MPNWCSNRLSITGPEAQLQAFQKKARSGPDGSDSLLSFEAFIAPPADVDPNTVVDWQTNNWGTKWDASDVNESSVCDQLSYEFSTAWSPPIEFCRTVFAEYPELEFELEFHEGGMDFAGHTEFQNGSVTVDEPRQVEEMCLDWYGYVNRMCPQCNEDFETEELDEHLCEECFMNRCAACNRMRDEHVFTKKGRKKIYKCPFSATTFKQRKDRKK